jgi:hypothetical protein
MVAERQNETFPPLRTESGTSHLNFEKGKTLSFVGVAGAGNWCQHGEIDYH